MRLTQRIALLALLLCSGCTQAFVEVRHERGQYGAPENSLAIGARWYFWDAYGDWLADKVRQGSK